MILVGSLHKTLNESIEHFHNYYKHYDRLSPENSQPKRVSIPSSPDWRSKAHSARNLCPILWMQFHTRFCVHFSTYLWRKHPKDNGRCFEKSLHKFPHGNMFIFLSGVLTARAIERASAVRSTKQNYGSNSPQSFEWNIPVGFEWNSFRK